MMVRHAGTSAINQELNHRGTETQRKAISEDESGANRLAKVIDRVHLPFLNFSVSLCLCGSILHRHKES